MPDSSSSRESGSTLAALGDPSWTAYSQTVLHFVHGETRWSLDLRADLPAAQMTRTLITLEVPAFAVLTACNPRGRLVDAEENARRTRALADRIAAAGRALCEVVGASPDDGHREPGFACAVDRAEARRLAVACEQSAFFWLDAAGAWLCGALVAHSPSLVAAVR